ncbi:homeodomain-like protein [Tanacetum coccineum]|uniref:Homeodomain-like protein n=1 Tax=Tanacetum coccineum TaxID=301880 RepID=A0ABQ5J7P7_9ASTR
MTRSSTNKLFTPYKEPEREFRSSRRHFKTLSLDELRSPDFNLLSNQEYSEEEVAETMAETMEQYTSKTRADYGSGVARPKIEDKDNFKLKGQFLKENLRTNTFRSDSEGNLVSIRIGNSYSYLDRFLDSRGAIPSKTAADAKKRNHNGPQFSKAYSEASYINNSIPRKDKDPGSFTLPCFINNICFDNALVDLGASVSVMPLSTYLNLGLGELAHARLTVELADRTVKYPKELAKNVLVGIGKFTFPVDFIILDIPEDIKVPLILVRPFLSTARAKIDVYKRKITLRVREEKIIFKSVKPDSSLIKRVYMLSLRERMKLDLEARFMGETLVLNRSLDPFFKDYIELYDLNEPIELNRNQGDNLIPTTKEGGVIEEFRTRDEDLDTRINDYPSYCDSDKKIYIDCAHNLKFSCMIGFKFTHANFSLLLYVNVMSKKFHNSIIKDKMVYKGNNVLGALMNVSIFVGTFSVVMDFIVLENMEDYLDEGMGDVIFGELFLREVGIKARRFEGMITIYNGDDKVTYQMVQSHLRFKNYTNEQCNKIPPLLKVSEYDEKNGISYAYQKLKGFYKGVLNLGPDYIRGAKMEEWLTRGHISVHETK